MEGAEAAVPGSSSPAQPRCSSCGSGPGGGEAAAAAAAAMEEPLGEAPSPGVAAGPRKQQGVKRHHHKHNLKHRYELQETLGKGTYGKVKRAIERFSGRVVRRGDGGFRGVPGDGGSGSPPWGRASPAVRVRGRSCRILGAGVVPW